MVKLNLIFISIILLSFRNSFLNNYLKENLLNKKFIYEDLINKYVKVLGVVKDIIKTKFEQYANKQDFLEEFNQIKWKNEELFKSYIVGYGLYSFTQNLENFDDQTRDKLVFDYINSHDAKKYFKIYKEKSAYDDFRNQYILEMDKIEIKIDNIMTVLLKKHNMKTENPGNLFFDFKFIAFKDEIIENYNEYISFLKKYTYFKIFNYKYMVIPALFLIFGFIKKFI